MGRLKLREVKGETDAKLIYYERENIAKPKRSSVFILTIPRAPRTIKQILEHIIKTKAVLEKVREIYFYKGTQIHLDTVKRLGSFIEFEHTSSQDSEKQKADVLKLEKLMKQLDIGAQRLERLSYSDLI